MFGISLSQKPDLMKEKDCSFSVSLWQCHGLLAPTSNTRKKNWADWQVAGKHPITTPLNHFGTLAWVHLGTMRKHPHPRCWSKRPSIKTMSQPWAASAEGRVGGQSKQPAGGTSEWSGALKKLDRSEGHVRRVENKWLMLQKHKMFLSMDSIGKRGIAKEIHLKPGQLSTSTLDGQVMFANWCRYGNWMELMICQPEGEKVYFPMWS